MNELGTIEELKVGIVISGRSDGRRLHASLQSVERLASRPSLVIVILRPGHDHLLAPRELAGSQLPIRILTSDGPADSWLTIGFRALAPVVDIAIFLSEGTILEGDYVRQTQRRYASWEDLIGMIEIVSDAVKVDANAAHSSLASESQTRDGFLRAWLRRRLRARSLMPSILSLRLTACRNINFVIFSEFCDWMSFALFLDRLRARGRTEVTMTQAAQEVRFGAERRSSFDFGYTLYNRLTRIEDYVDVAPEVSYLSPSMEKTRLFAEQALQYLLSACTDRNISTMMRGMLASRRDIKVQARAIQREIRDLA